MLAFSLRWLWHGEDLSVDSDVGIELSSTPSRWWDECLRLDGREHTEDIDKTSSGTSPSLPHSVNTLTKLGAFRDLVRTVLRMLVSIFTFCPVCTCICPVVHGVKYRLTTTVWMEAGNWNRIKSLKLTQQWKILQLDADELVSIGWLHADWGIRFCKVHRKEWSTTIIIIALRNYYKLKLTSNGSCDAVLVALSYWLARVGVVEPLCCVECMSNEDT